VTPLIKRLELNGLVERQRRTDDERVVEVAPTPQGTALSHHARAVPLAIGDAMGLSPEEFRTAQELLRRLTANVIRHTTAPQPTGTHRP
jgi:DNA-binding MarR family transcriptional regulator